MGDGSGLETSRRQNYCENKMSTKEFLTSIVDSREIVQAFDFSGIDECLVMDSLVEEVEGDSLCLDAGFNDRELVRKIVEKGIIPYVYPKKINRMNGGNGCILNFLLMLLLGLQNIIKEFIVKVFIQHLKEFMGLLAR